MEVRTRGEDFMARRCARPFLSFPRPPRGYEEEGKGWQHETIQYSTCLSNSNAALMHQFVMQNWIGLEKTVLQVILFLCLITQSLNQLGVLTLFGPDEFSIRCSYSYNVLENGSH